MHEFDRIITHASLIAYLRRGLRNGNWTTLDNAEKALFRCALWLAKARGKISNTKLIVEVLKIALKLAENLKSEVFEAGRKRSLSICEMWEKAGVFVWAPQVKQWLSDVNYVWYLGMLKANP